MSSFQENLSDATVTLPAAAFRKMLKLVRLLDRLSHQPEYRAQVYPMVPEVARFDPGHDAVMMCYDFHLVGDTPKLIEVNTNAGGGLLAYLSQESTESILTEALKMRVLRTFSQEIAAYSKGRVLKPQRVVIIDEAPQDQYLYPEMLAFVELFKSWGVAADIVDPDQLMVDANGVSVNQQQVDMIYNRHCDFYLESESMAAVRSAYLAGKVCLTPNPHMYGLLADKRRMLLWLDPGKRSQLPLSEIEQSLLDEILPASMLLSELDLQQIWSARKTHVFKPVDSFGSRGVLLGEKISRKRFEQLPPETTLVQELVPPSLTETANAGPMKTDLRLYAYRNRVLGVTARLYRGQVTNMRTPGGGFARVDVN